MSKKEAQKLGALGYPVFPCEGRRPKKGFKWKQSSATERKRIASMFSDWPHNVGVAVPRGAIVVDLDRKRDDNGKIKNDGVQALREIMPVGWRHTGPKTKTGGGGFHLWFRVPEILGLGNSSGDLPDGIDIRAGGKGYVIVPPSIHPKTGDPYVWLRPPVPISELPELPAWLIVRLIAEKEGSKPASPSLASSFAACDTDRPVREQYLQGAIKCAVERVEAAGKGNRNKTLNQEAYDLARLAAHGLDLQEAEERLFTAATFNGLTARESRATIGSAFRGGSKRVRNVPESARERPKTKKSTAPTPSAAATELRARPERVSGPSVKRPTIEVGTDELLINDRAAVALAEHGYSDLYQRSGGLCRIVRTAGKPTEQPSSDGVDYAKRGRAKVLTVPQGTPTIRPLGLPTLRERLSDCVQWQKPGSGAPCHPPEWSVKAVHARGEWPGMPPLAGIADYPLVRLDGSMSTETGYDAETSYYLGDGIKGTKVPDRPTAKDAAAAAAELLELVGDFPFATDVDRAAWLALLLTPLARAVTAGPTPLFVIEANVRGTGKTLLASLVGSILTGRDLPLQTYAYSDEELEKIFVSVARLGLPMLCFDNVRGTIGGGTIDKWITSTTPSGRVLGSSEIPVFDWQTVVMATANNASIAGDTDRRAIYIKLKTDHEQPELRDDFRVVDIRAHARARRPRYLGAALTILRAHALSGWADHGGRPKGTFEAWVQRVRDAVMHAGLPDCERPPNDPSRPVDKDKALLGPVLVSLSQSFGAGEWFSVGDILELAFPPARDSWGEDKPLRNALSSISQSGGRPAPQYLGRKLSTWRDRWLGDMCLISRQDGHSKQNLWSIKTRNAGSAGCQDSDSSSLPAEKPEQLSMIAGRAGSAGSVLDPAHAIAREPMGIDQGIDSRARTHAGMDADFLPALPALPANGNNHSSFSAGRDDPPKIASTRTTRKCEEEEGF